MIKKIGIALACALSVGLLFAPVDAFARHGGGHGHGGGHMHHGGGGHHGGWHGGWRHSGPHFRRPVFAHRGFGRPHFGGRPLGRWRGPQRAFVGGSGFYRPYPVRARFGYGGFGPGGCSTRRSVVFCLMVGARS